MWQADASIRPQTRTTVKRISYHGDGTITLTLNRPNVELHLPADDITDPDRVAWRLRSQFGGRHQLHGEHEMQATRELRRRKWQRVLDNAEIIKPEPVKRKGRPRKEEVVNE